MSKCLQILIMIVILCSSAFSQNEKLVDINSFDNTLLEELIHQEINRVRDSLKLKTLTDDEQLKAAADIQCNYITSQNILTHTHSLKKYATIKNRVMFAGSKHQYIAENIAYIGVANPITYRDLAKKFVYNWLHSPTHLKNIKNSRYTYSGISCKVNKKSNRVYASQVFGD